ncbi:BCL-6 corepressor-like isoform X2 [Scleropages formosus]|uniref:BCL-6 corepressor-like isoform X2 n=1 Tax=Scleropages formosus TaxID=113540 RepID=UPI0010FA8F01|nr:BCL-6 corepressor isoform X2 [Scleropages formosus]
MLSATPLYGPFHSWMSNERVHMCGINEDRKVPVSDGDTQKSCLELTEGNPITQGMVDASTACRMNPLAALSMDRTALMRESLRMHGGVVYPGVRALSTDKAREGSSVPLGYVSDHLSDLHYKPDIPLESRKAANGYVGLYKSPPPGLQKTVLVPAGGGDALGLDRHVGPADKPSELGLNGSSSYLRMPWVSPYPEAAMYPYLDSKYAALSMYKASFMSQPTPYLPQHLPYQPLCAGAGGSTAGAERLFYVPPYPPAPISSPLAPPMRIPTATVAPTALSPLVHCQDKGLQSMGPRMHHEPSAFGQQLHQQPSQTHHLSHSGGSASKSSRISSSKSSSSSSSSTSSSSTCSLPVDSTPASLMQSPRTITRLPQPSVPPPPLLVDSSLDFQKPLPPGPPPSSSCATSSPSTPLSYYMTSMGSEHGHSSPARSTSQKSKLKEGNSERGGSGTERRPSKSPSRTAEKHPLQASTKDPVDKPLDLSSKIDFGDLTNGFPAKAEAFAKLGHSPSTRYGLPPSREHLKETFSPSSSVSVSSKPSQRPEIISTLHSSWVVPGPVPALTPESGQTKGPSVIKNMNLERVMPQQRSSSCPRIGESNNSPAPNPVPAVVTPTGRPASASPSPNMNGEWSKPTAASVPEKTSPASHISNQVSSGKPSKAPKRTEAQEVTYKPQQPHLENGHTPSHLYLTPNEPFLPPSLAYNRYLPYSVPDSMSLPHIQLPTKGPVYPPHVLLSNTSLYPPRLAPKHSLPYGLPPSHGDFLTYHDSQEMVHPLMAPHLALETKTSERLEKRPQSQEKPRSGDNSTHRSRHTVEATDTPPKHDRDTKLPNKPPAAEQEKVVCIDLIQGDTDGHSQAAKHTASDVRKGDPIGHEGSGNARKEPELMQLLMSSQAGAQGAAGLEDACPPPAVRRDCGSPDHSQGEESPAECSPLPDPLEQQTLRCARTAGDRTGEESNSRARSERHGLPCHAELSHSAVEYSDSHPEDDDDGSIHMSRHKKSSLAKRIANSSGYVGDRFKCITNELYTDSSKLSREQRALQRAMLRFSELELKEREGGIAVGQELAGGQPREGIQRIGRLGDTALRDGAEMDGVQLMCRNNSVPVLQRCAPQSVAPPLREQIDRAWEGSLEACLLTAEVPALGDRGHGTGPTNKRPHGVEAEETEEDRAAALAKRPRLIAGLTAAPLTGHHGRCPDLPSPQDEMERAAGGDDTDEEPAPRLRRYGDLEKPKGKRQCKTKHLSLRERRRALESPEERMELDRSPEYQVGMKLSASPVHYQDSPVKPRPPSPCPAAPLTTLQSLPSQPSPLAAGNPPPDTPASRPMPPEARRLIVNKNAGETLLQRAARLGYEEVVLYCLENKVCDVNHRDNAGYCALHEACARGWLSIVQHLVEHGADINCSAQDGTRPLHDAVENDHLDVVRLLLSYGADPTLATYSGRSLLKMTHSDLMACFLSDYFADLQGRANDDDPGLYWDFYGSSVCEPTEDPSAFDILADPPGPGDKDEEPQHREVFEFEFSDQPLLPCYNIQVSLSQGPRNWLLLSDVLKRLKMSARAFRTAFAHIEVATIAEAEFYKQASLSQLFSCPEELEGFLPNSTEPLDLVEISGELATLLGSSIECLDARWDPVPVATS